MSNIETAITVLEEQIKEILTVCEWATKTGFDSTKYFSRKIRDFYGRRPKKIIIEKKLELIEKVLSQSGNETFQWVAGETGFENDNALGQFVNRHTDKSLTQLKTECQNRVSKQSVKTECQNRVSKQSVKTMFSLFVSCLFLRYCRNELIDN